MLIVDAAQLITSQNWLWKWLGGEQANAWIKWFSSQTHIYVNMRHDVRLFEII